MSVKCFWLIWLQRKNIWKLKGQNFEQSVQPDPKRAWTICPSAVLELHYSSCSFYESVFLPIYNQSRALSMCKDLIVYKWWRIFARLSFWPFRFILFYFFIFAGIYAHSGDNFLQLDWSFLNLQWGLTSEVFLLQIFKQKVWFNSHGLFLISSLCKFLLQVCSLPNPMALMDNTHKNMANPFFPPRGPKITSE